MNPLRYLFFRARKQGQITQSAKNTVAKGWDGIPHSESTSTNRCTAMIPKRNVEQVRRCLKIWTNSAFQTNEKRKLFNDVLPLLDLDCTMTVEKINVDLQGAVTDYRSAFAPSARAIPSIHEDTSDLMHHFEIIPGHFARRRVVGISSSTHSSMISP